MAGFFSGTAKRKQVEEFYDDFSGLPLSSPATKIRRLDADMISIERDGLSASDSLLQDMEPEITDNTSTYTCNDNRSLVIYDAFESPLAFSPNEPNVSFKVSPELIRGIKNNSLRLQDKTIFNIDEKVGSNGCLALVPWVPSPASIYAYEFVCPESRSESSDEPMEVEEAEATFMEMEVEENRVQTGISEIKVDKLQPWKQQCLTPQVPPYTTSPIMW